MHRIFLRLSTGILALMFVVPMALGCSRKNQMTPPPEKLEQAIVQYDKGNRRAAKRLFLQTLKESPRSSRAHYYLALIYELEGERDMAIVGLEKAIEYEPVFPEAYYNLGTIYLKRSEYTTAIQLLEVAADLRPEHAPTFVNIGIGYYRVGLLELAIGAFEEALRLDPGNKSATENLELIRRAAERSAQRQKAAE